MTTQPTQPQPGPPPPKPLHWWNDKELILRGLAQSNYITAWWDWFMMLLGKAAEPVLFVSVLYSGYELLPGVPQPGAVIDAPMFITQQAALDIGGLGLMKMAKRAKLPKDSFPYCVGIILVVLMIVNVAMASLEKVVHLPPFLATGVEGFLLIARAVMAVLYGHAIHALKDEGVTLSHGQSRVQAQVEQVQVQVEELAEGVQQQEVQVQQQGVQLEQLALHLTELVQQVRGFREELHRVQSELPHLVQQGVQSEVQNEVQSLHTEVQHLIEQLPVQVQEQVQQVVQQQRLNPIPEQRAQYHRSQGAARGSAGAASSEQEVQPSDQDEPLELHPHPVQGSGAVNRSGKQGEQGSKVQRFITEQLASGHTPTLKEIMEECHCSKNTAIQHRRALTRRDEQEPGQPKLTVVRG